MSDPSLAPRTTIFREEGLIVIFLITLVYVGVVFLTPGSPVRIPLGFVELVFAPGYALGAVLFLRRPLLPPGAEFSVSVGLSVVFNVLVGLLLSVLGTGLAIAGLVIADSLVVSLGLVLKAVREDTPGISSATAAIRRELRLPGVRPSYRTAVYALLVASAVAFAGVLYLGYAQPPAGTPTSIALSGANGTTSSIPKYLIVGQVGLVVLFIADGYSNGSIALAVTATSQNSTMTNLTPAQWTVPLSLSNGTTSSLPLALAYGDHATMNVTFEFTQPGNFTLEFALQDAGGAALQGAALGLQVRT